MKKILMGFCVIGCVNLFAFDCPLEYFKSIKKIKCPETLLKEGSAKEIKESNKYLVELENVSTVKAIYIDVLKGLHQEDDINKFVNKKSFEDFIETNLFTNLLAAKTLKNEERYEEILSKVDTNNPYWCQVIDGGKNNE
ncbi:hypothetical protein ACOL3H_06690 [Aliarcobacter butzleri]